MHISFIFKAKNFGKGLEIWTPALLQTWLTVWIILIIVLVQCFLLNSLILESEIYFFHLIFILAVVFMAPQVDAGRCTEVLNPNSCDLATCKSMCFTKHKSNSGECQVNGGTPLKPTYKCVCYYNCPATMMH